MEKLNREQRRQAKFGGGRANEQGGWPTSEPNPVFGGEDSTEATPAPDAKRAPDAKPAADKPDEAMAGRPDQGQTKQTGPGTGGATQQDGRAPRHEGAHTGISTKG